MWELSKRFKNGKYWEEEDELLLEWQILVEDGADPTWLPPPEEGSSASSSSEEDEETALFVFLNELIPLLWIIEDKYGEKERDLLQGILREFIKTDCGFKDPRKRNVIHAILDYHRDSFGLIGDGSSITESVWRHLLGIIREVLADRGRLIDETDWKGKTPLHRFIDSFQEWKSIDEDVIRSFMYILKSEENIYEEGINIIHVLEKNITSTHVGDLCGLILYLGTTTNLNAKDRNGDNVFHLLAKKFRSEEDLDAIWDLIHELKTEIDLNSENNEEKNVFNLLFENVRNSEQFEKVFFMILDFKSELQWNVQNDEYGQSAFSLENLAESESLRTILKILPYLTTGHKTEEEVLLLMIKKASVAIGSDLYCKIIEVRKH